MSQENKELEVKFYISDLEQIENKIKKKGGTILQNRCHEYNLRFDKLTRELTQSFQVLRLRHDSDVHLTYKGPGLMEDGVRSRKEIEVTVSDFENTQKILEALGFQVSMVYEKYRMSYGFEGVVITLDEMPYGNFVEIEGPDPVSIFSASKKLGLDWNYRVMKSYTQLFDVVRDDLAVRLENLTFDDFSDIEVTPANLGVQPADE